VAWGRAVRLHYPQTEMTTRTITGRFVLGVLLLSCVSSTASAQLPEGPGKDVTVRICGVCHDSTTAAAVRLSRAGWEATIDDMLARGAMATDEEYVLILDYLATNFLGEGSKPLNMNTATAIQLESVLELLRKEAAAIIAYREKNGAFKSIDDLKKVTDVPFRKIESKKDRLVFGIVPKKVE
jgi:competence protein ComEA